MADFLNRLAGRALGAIPLAEPVIPTRFSPTEPGASFAAEATFRPTRPFPETSFEPSSQFLEDHPRPLRSRVDQPGFEPSVDPTVSPLEELNQAPHRPLPQRPRAVAPQEPQPLHRDRETVQPSSERVQTQRQHLASAIDPLTGDVERIVAHRPAATSPEPAPFAEPRPSQHLAPLAEPTRSPAAQHSEPLAFRHAPPSVRVSIGRIEVRAEISSPVPAPPPQRRSQPSTLSLDEFLKQAGSRQ
jgi:hypothetical protein